MFAMDHNAVGPQKATLERRHSRNRNRRGSIPDIKEPSTEIKEKLRNMRQPSSSVASQKTEPVSWEQNFVQYLERKRSNSFPTEATTDLSNIRLSSSATSFQGLFLQSRTASIGQLPMPRPRADAGGVRRPMCPKRCVSAPDLFSSSRKLSMRRYPRSMTDTSLITQLEPRQGRSAELVLQLATGWS